MTPAGPSLVKDGDPDAGLRSSHPPSGFAPSVAGSRTTVELHQLRAELLQEINTRAGADSDRAFNDVAHDLVLVARELTTNALRTGDH